MSSEDDLASTLKEGRVGYAIALLVMVMMATPVDAMAQEDAGEQAPMAYVGGPSAERRLELYEEAKLDRKKAMLYSLALPGLGNFHADKLFRGAAWMGVFGMSVFSGLAGWRTSDNRLVILGITGGVVCYGGSLVTTYYDVNAYNERLRSRYKVSEPNEEGALERSFGIGYTWRF